jgi:hypothetical protein
MAKRTPSCRQRDGLSQGLLAWTLRLAGEQGALPPADRGVGSHRPSIAGRVRRHHGDGRRSFGRRGPHRILAFGAWLLGVPAGGAASLANVTFGALRFHTMGLRSRCRRRLRPPPRACCRGFPFTRRRVVRTIPPLLERIGETSA